MNKTELIRIIASEGNISQARARIVLDSILRNIGSTLHEGGRVTLPGFGTWTVSTRAAREGRSPQTGKTIKIASKKVVKFKPGSVLNARIDKGTTGTGARERRDKNG